MKFKQVLSVSMVLVLFVASVVIGIVLWRGTEDLSTLGQKKETLSYVSTEGAKWAEQYLVPTTTIIFDGDGQEEIGRLEWSTGKFVFVGEAEESALVFFEHFLKVLVDEYIECEVRKLVARGK